MTQTEVITKLTDKQVDQEVINEINSLYTTLNDIIIEKDKLYHVTMPKQRFIKYFTWLQEHGE